MKTFLTEIPDTVSHDPQRGFALLIAVIFMSVMLAIGIALSSLGYKQQVLASSAVNSQYAFYSADAALECALYADSKGAFAYNNFSKAGDSTSFSCDGLSHTATVTNWTPQQIVLSAKSVETNSNTRCADITIYKPNPLTNPSGISTIYALGYDVPCGTVISGSGSFVARGLKSFY